MPRPVSARTAAARNRNVQRLALRDQQQNAAAADASHAEDLQRRQEAAASRHWAAGAGDAPPPLPDNGGQEYALELAVMQADRALQLASRAVVENSGVGNYERRMLEQQLRPAREKAMAAMQRALGAIESPGSGGRDDPGLVERRIRLNFQLSRGYQLAGNTGFAEAHLKRAQALRQPHRYDLGRSAPVIDMNRGLEVQQVQNPYAGGAHEDVNDLGAYLGMVPHRDCRHMWIALAALNAPPPPGWKEAFDEEGYPYYIQQENGVVWQSNPRDAYFRQLVRFERYRAHRKGFRKDVGVWMECESAKGEVYYHNWEVGLSSSHRAKSGVVPCQFAEWLAMATEREVEAFSARQIQVCWRRKHVKRGVELKTKEVAAAKSIQKYWKLKKERISGCELAQFEQRHLFKLAADESELLAAELQTLGEAIEQIPDLEDKRGRALGANASALDAVEQAAMAIDKPQAQLKVEQKVLSGVEGEHRQMSKLLGKLRETLAKEAAVDAESDSVKTTQQTINSMSGPCEKLEGRIVECKATVAAAKEQAQALTDKLAEAEGRLEGLAAERIAADIAWKEAKVALTRQAAASAEYADSCGRRDDAEAALGRLASKLLRLRWRPETKVDRASRLRREAEAKSKAEKAAKLQKRKEELEAAERRVAQLQKKESARKMTSMFETKAEKLGGVSLRVKPLGKAEAGFVARGCTMSGFNGFARSDGGADDFLEYDIAIDTMDASGAAIDCAVGLAIKGSLRGCWRHRLDPELARFQAYAHLRNAFARGSSHRFTLTLRDLGRLESMRIGHAGHGLDQSWGLERVTVRVEARDETTVFEYGKVIDKHIPYEDAGRTGSKHGWRGVTIAGAAQAKLGQTTLVQLNVIGCTKLRKADKFGKSDPYVVVVVDGKRAGQTEVIQDDQNPRWGEADGLGEPIDVTVHERSVVTVAVYDADGDADVGDGLPDGDDDHLGEVVLTGAQICALPEHDDDGGHAILELQPGDNHKASGSIELSRE